MKKRIEIICLFAFCLFWNADIAQATNFGFLPGDSCFHVKLDKGFVESIQEEKAPVFNYERPEGAGFMLCGYGGFFKMKYVDMPVAFKANLKKVYEKIRSEYPLQVMIYPEKKWSNELQKDVLTGKTIREEINAIHVFFVNAEFDLKRHRIGLKYNENWAEEMQAIAKHKLEQTHLDLFVNNSSAVMTDWRDAKLVRRLDVKCPEPKTKNYQVPVEVSGKLKAIVLPTGKVSEYYNAKGYYVVDENGIQAVKGRSGEGPAKNAGGLFNP